MIKRILTTVLCLATLCVAAQDHHDRTSQKSVTTLFCYPSAGAWINPDIQQNAEAIEILKNTAKDIAEVKTILVQSYSSPEGLGYQNKELAARRSRSAIALLKEILPDIREDILSVENIGDDWQSTRDYLSHNSDLPGAQTALRAIDTMPLRIIRQGELIDSRKRHVMEADEGRLWNTLKDEAFMSMRRTEVTITYVEKAKENPAATTPEQEQTPTASTDEAEPAPQPLPETSTLLEDTPDKNTRKQTDDYHSAVVGIHTNILADVATAMNFGLEIPMGNRSSFLADIYFPRYKNWTPWWSDSLGPYDVQITAFNLGYRWYAKRWDLRDHNVLRWFFLQANAGGGFYTFDKPSDENLVQGYWFHAGLGAGVNIPLARWWRLRLSGAYGGAYLNTKLYSGHDITGAPILKDETGTFGWAPTYAEFSLMYVINHKPNAR